MDLRKDFFEIMYELAEKDKDIIILVGDLGYSFYEKFKEKYPNQLINAGCAEQNMLGVAAGLARAGKKPYVYSGSIFLCMRAYEQLRDDIAYANLDVKLVGTGASSFLGFTHVMSPDNEDELIIGHLPNLEFLKPQTKEVLEDYLIIKGPAYIKI